MEIAWYWKIWPWIGCGMAIVLCILLFGTNNLRRNLSISRWKDAYWLGWLTTTAYLLHNVEEYGISLFGEPYAFPHMMFNMFGVAMPSAFFPAVNLPLFWLVGPLAAWMAKKYPTLSLGMSGLLLLNFFSHLEPFFTGIGYTPGALTAITIFLPLSLWTFWSCCGKKQSPFSLICMIWYICSGAIAHVILIGSIMLFVHGMLSIEIFVLIQLLNAGFTFFLWYGAKPLLGKKLYRHSTIENK